MLGRIEEGVYSFLKNTINVKILIITKIKEEIGRNREENNSSRAQVSSSLDIEKCF